MKKISQKFGIRLTEKKSAIHKMPMMKNVSQPHMGQHATTKLKEKGIV